jgi:SAM-dependent methyltransferase
MELSLPPPEYMRLVGAKAPNLREDFEDVGRRLARQLARLKMLEQGARLLDIGCGCGRVARHLLNSPIAEYAGFDRHPGMIEWSQSHIGTQDDRFHFQHVDVESGYAELDSHLGAVSAAEFVFPYDDAEFTGALAASVFTHIDFPATSRYLNETARVLAPSGCVLASFFRGETTGSLGDSSWNFVIQEDDLRHAIEEAALEVVLLDPTPARPPSRQSWFLLSKPGV